MKELIEKENYTDESKFYDYIKQLVYFEECIEQLSLFTLNVTNRIKLLFCCFFCIYLDIVRIFI